MTLQKKATRALIALGVAGWGAAASAQVFNIPLHGLGSRLCGLCVPGLPCAFSVCPGEKGGCSFLVTEDNIFIVCDSDILP